MIVRALAVLITLTSGIAAAPPAHATPVPAKAVLSQTKHADVDGDGRLDIVRIYNAGKKAENTLWRVKVRTAAGHAGSLTVPIPSYQATTSPWRGWALLDGHRGAEILLEPQTDDFTTYIVLTWRGNALHRELAPRDPGGGKQQAEWTAATEIDRSGYRFLSRSGKRYVNAWQAACPEQPDKPGMCRVKTVRSVWRDGAWHKVATLPTTKVSNTDIYRRSPLGALVIHR